MPTGLKLEIDNRRLDGPGFFDEEAIEEFDAFIDPATKTVKAFTSRAAFQRAARGSGLFPDLGSAFDALATARAGQASENEAVLRRQAAAWTAKQTQVRALLRRRKVGPGDARGLRRLHASGELGSMIVYDRKGCVGDWAYFPPPGPYPKLSWFGWNDRISSLYNIGVLASLHQHTWFRGKTLWIPLGAGYKDLGWWSNRASSMVFYLG